MIRRGLGARGWDCRALPQPVFDRERGGGLAAVRFGLGLALAWLKALRLLFAGDAGLAVNLGLTPVAFMRDGVPLLLGRLGLGRERIVLSLHGSLFMTWEPGALRTRVFCFLLRQGGLVTVLGEGHRRRLVTLGLPSERVAVVINSCTLPPLSATQLDLKWPARVASVRPLRLLHLGSLYASKGFPEFLEAAAILAGRSGPALEVVLCGRVADSGFEDRFGSVAAAEQWIEATIEGINRGGRVRARWVRGAVGAEKQALFHEADLFVLPTRYAVEAQPLVLLEAMASGCAILTTRVGEIATILDAASARFLETGATAELVTQIEEFIARPGALAALAVAAHRRFVEHYDLEHHLAGWERIFAPVPVRGVTPTASAWHKS